MPPLLYHLYWLLSEYGGPVGIRWHRWMKTCQPSHSQPPPHLQSRATSVPDLEPQRWGKAVQSVSDAPIVWIHAVSVGESLSALPVASRIQASFPGTQVLLTVGTQGAAEVLQKRAPPAVIWQMAPYDIPSVVATFLESWRPKAGIFVESELWPNMISMAANRNIPLALMNARMSTRSFQRWNRWPQRSLVRSLLAHFRVVLCQSEMDAAKFAALGADGPKYIGNLKAASSLHVDDAAVQSFASAVASRPVWLAASTHAAEHQVAVDVHRQLLPHHPRLLTVIAPRHPPHPDYIQNLVYASALRVELRSRSPLPSSACDIYVADTLGELGVFYSACPVAFVGGSLVDGIGGHNVLEAASLGCATLHGRHMQNFTQLVADMLHRNSASLTQVTCTDDLASRVSLFLSDAPLLQAASSAGRTAAAAVGEGVLDATMQQLHPFLSAALQPPTP